jgi:hypothetical protein
LPPLIPVPGFGYPNWWSSLPATAEPLINDPLDPRWSGAVKQLFSYGGSPHVTLRLGTSSDASGAGVDLQWMAWVDPASGQASLEGVWVALSDGTDAGLLHFSLSQTPSGNADPKTLAGTRYWYKAVAANSWNELLDANSNPTAPTWATTTARQWLTPPSAAYVWAMAVRVPIVAGTFANPNSGLNLGATFSLAYELDASDGVTPTPNAIAYAWPTQTYMSSDDPNATPDGGYPITWGTVNQNVATTCAGVGIEPGDLSTDYPGDDHAFHRDADNTLHAKPHNSTGADVSGIKATFRIADWGSQIGEFTAGDTPWKTLGTSPPGVIPGAGSMQGDLTFLWGADPYWHDPAQHLNHQCMYVELSSDGSSSVLFSPDSAWTNMHFGPASKFEEDARISIKGLPSLGAAPGRDVYLYFQTFNMNSLSPPRSLPPPVPVTASDHGKGPGAGRDEPAPATIGPLVPLPKLELDNFKTPSYRVHVYHDTGRKFQTPDSQWHKVLEPQGDYGWFITHAGADTKTEWKVESKLNPDATQRSPGAATSIDKIRPDWWRLFIDNGGFLTLTSTVTAENWPPWWLILLLIVLFIIIIAALVLRRLQS